MNRYLADEEAQRLQEEVADRNLEVLFQEFARQFKDEKPLEWASLNLQNSASRSDFLSSLSKALSQEKHGSSNLAEWNYNSRIRRIDFGKLEEVLIEHYSGDEQE